MTKCKNCGHELTKIGGLTQANQKFAYTHCENTTKMRRECRSIIKIEFGFPHLCGCTSPEPELTKEEFNKIYDSISKTED